MEKSFKEENVKNPATKVPAAAVAPCPSSSLWENVPAMFKTTSSGAVESALPPRQQQFPRSSRTSRPKPLPTLLSSIWVASVFALTHNVVGIVVSTFLSSEKVFLEIASLKCNRSRGEQTFLKP